MRYAFSAYLVVFLGYAALTPSAVNAQKEDFEDEAETLHATQSNLQLNTSEWNSNVSDVPVVYAAESVLEDSENNLENNNTDWMKDPHRIVGGQPIPITQTPWQAVVYKDRFFVCGGSVISLKWVLTAAHCVAKGKYAVRVGSRFHKRGGYGRSISFIVVHGGYNHDTFRNDIAMMRVRTPFIFGPTVRPIPLAKPLAKRPAQYVVSGWGRIKYNGATSLGLRAVTVNSMSRNVCREKYRGEVTVYPTQLCAAARGKDSCQGDSGGPLVSFGKLYGVVSSGIGCADRRYPGLYTDVRKYNGWIAKMALKFSFA